MRGQAFLLPALFKTLVAPPVLTAVVLAILPPIPVTLALLLYVIAFPALFSLRGQISIWRHDKQARAIAAVPITRVSGKWPLNLDVLVDWAKSGAEEEVGRMIVLLSRNYGRTFNTRVLGEDQV
jgi:hypothetical protein